MVKLTDLLSIIEEFSPLRISDALCKQYSEYDNSGLLVGTEKENIERVMVCLDVTDAVIDEAIAWHADLILSHHPILYHGIKQIGADEPVARVLRAGIGVYSAHLNLDGCSYGINRYFAEKCGLESSVVLMPVGEKEGLMRLGQLREPMCLRSYGEQLSKVFGCSVAIMGEEDRQVFKVVAVNGGGGNIEFLREAKAAGADCYVSGDFSHHVRREVELLGMIAVEIDHYYAEKGYISRYVMYLQELVNRRGFVVTLKESEREKCPFKRFGFYAGDRG